MKKVIYLDREYGVNVYYKFESSDKLFTIKNKTTIQNTI